MQLSRPFMIALGAVVAVLAAWMLFLHPHGASTSSGSPAASSSASSGPQAPGVKGLVTAVGKAHAAVAQSQHAAAAVSSETADSPHPGGASAIAATGGTAAAAPSGPATGTGKAVFKPSPAPPSSPAATSHATAPGSRAAEVTGPISQGKVVVILFWDPKAADDQATQRQLAGVSRRDGRVVVLQATPDQVASFGNVTRGLQLLETPTTVVIDHRYQATTLSGLTDTATIEQAVIDAERGAGSVQTPSLSPWTTGSARSQYIGRADNVCRALSRQGSNTGTLAQQINSFHQYALAAIAQVNTLRAIPEPAADRVVLTRWFNLLDRSVGEIDSAVSAAVAHHYVQARTLYFQSQADTDRSTQGLADYGLTACFPGPSRSS